MLLSRRAERFLAEVEAAESACRRYVPKDTARAPHFRAAADCWDRYAEAYRAFLDEHQHLLVAAEEAERRAEFEEIPERLSAEQLGMAAL